MSDNDFVVYEVDAKGIGRITLNRPEKRNAFDDQIIAELTARLRQADGDDQVRVVVLAANGKHFSAGADLNWMKRTAAMSEEENVRDARELAELMLTLDRLSKPTIARVQGAAMGGALGLICCCDIAVASDDARFCLSEARLGLAPAAISPYVVRAMGARAARRYFLTTEIIAAATALRLNVVHEVLPEEQLDSQVNELCEQLRKSGPVALDASKRLVQEVEANFPDAELREYTARLIARLRTGEEGQEGLAAFLEKRSARWCEE